MSRLPAMYDGRESIEADGLILYSVNVADSWRRTAADGVKILKGAKSADLPVEQVTKLDLVINLGTAQVPGLTLPPSLLFQADVAIQ